METSDLPVVHPDREQLTEEEARRVGTAAYRVAKLRRLLKAAQTPKSGTLIVGRSTAWEQAPFIEVDSLSMEAVLALLIERDELFLASFNVKVERP